MPEELSYSDLLAERDTYKAEIAALKQDRVNRQAKNSVFLNLFTRKEYQLQLYKELFPLDTTITEAALEMITLENVLTIHPYNNLGLLSQIWNFLRGASSSSSPRRSLRGA